MPDAMVRFAWIAVGGAAGSVLRYLLAGLVQQSVVLFPVGTLLVNVAGCFLIGLLSVWFGHTGLAPLYRTAVIVGGLGGFTTFSTFSLETNNLLERGQYAWALLNASASLVGCLVAAALGMRLARYWISA